MITKILRAEPILSALITNAAFWPTVFMAASAFGHPIPDNQQHALIAIAALISAVVLRQNMSAPDTVQQELSDIKSINQKVSA